MTAHTARLTADGPRVFYRGALHNELRVLDREFSTMAAASRAADRLNLLEARYPNLALIPDGHISKEPEPPHR